MPPTASAVAVPLVPPLQLTFDELCIDEVAPATLTTFTEALDVQPLASVMVTVYAPARRLDAVIPFPPDGDHAYCSAPVPPEAFTDVVPLALPQLEGVEVAEALMAEGSLMVTFAVLIHPFASVTVTE